MVNLSILGVIPIEKILWAAMIDSVTLSAFDCFFL